MGLIRSTSGLQTRLIVIGVGCWLLGAARVDANSITINNIREDVSVFNTRVQGSVGFFPPLHFLVDIPNTPWESSSNIVEVPGGLTPAPDAFSVSWTIQHLIGPDPSDINPNPTGPVTLSLLFFPTAAGAFGVSPTSPLFSCDPTVAGAIFSTKTITHSLTTGGSHFDDFCLEIWGTASSNFLGGLDIDSYSISYVAVHCDQFNPATFGCLPSGPGGVGGMTAAVPEPTTLVLLGIGMVLMAHRRSRRLGGSIRDDGAMAARPRRNGRTS